MDRMAVFIDRNVDYILTEKYQQKIKQTENKPILNQI